jgi:hypothetical protein
MVSCNIYVNSALCILCSVRMWHLRIGNISARRPRFREISGDQVRVIAYSRDNGSFQRRPAALVCVYVACMCAWACGMKYEGFRVAA